MKFSALRIFQRWQPVEPAADPQVLLRLEYWLDFKRLHLAFLQTLNARTYGHSSTLALVQAAMLASYETQRLNGQYKAGAPDLILGKPMRSVMARCSKAYALVSDNTFDDKALADIGLTLDFDVIECLQAMIAAPITKADQLVEKTLRENGRDDGARVHRFSEDIAKVHVKLTETFGELESWTKPEV